MSSVENNRPAPGGTSITLREIFVAYLRMGFTAFGPAIAAETKKDIVKKKQWISEEEFLNGLALAQIIPGATFVSLTNYIGYRLRGILGAVTACIGFLLPPFTLMVLLSYLYFRFGQMPLIKTLFQGIMAVVVGIIASAIVDIGKSAITGIRGGIIAAISLGIMLAYPNIFVILAATAAAGILLFYRGVKERAEVFQQEKTHSQLTDKSKTGKGIAALAAIAAFIAYCTSLQPGLLHLAMVFFKVGALVFGNGFTMIPLIQQEVVNHYHWLTMEQFAVGIALGQVTPGPVAITATFVGYRVAGIIGAIAATLGIFLPSLFFVVLTAEAHQKVKNNIWVKAAIKGILASFVGMMLVVLLGLAKHSVVDAITAAFAAAAFLFLRFTKIGVLWIVMGGALLYLAVSSII